jgi:predicted metalloprotease with PDZ domain
MAWNARIYRTQRRCAKRHRRSAPPTRYSRGRAEKLAQQHRLPSYTDAFSIPGRRSIATPLAKASLLMPPSTADSPARVRYRIAVHDPHAHLFEVRCTVDAPAPGGQRFRLPTWTPGSYLIREFARHFVSVSAACEGREVSLVKVAKDVWAAQPCNGPLTVTALVYAYDLSVRAAYLDGSRAYFNGASVFLCPEGLADAPSIVDVVAPAGESGRNWRVATTLARAGAEAWGFGTYRAHDYDELIDHPVEIADFAKASFEAGGVTHDVTLTSRKAGDLDRLSRDLARICQWQIELFGSETECRAPFDRYLFQITAVGDGYGGLEHRSSTSLLCRHRELPQPGVEEISDGYRNLLGLASHEYFHSWNVKRIKPAAFSPYDLSRENYTSQLWAFEGFTSYYDDLALLRSCVIDSGSYLELLGRTITTVMRTPGRHQQSVAASSFDAWIKYYRQDENSPNAIVSYYTKGALVGLALDLELRGGGSSLDAVMRALWQRHGKAGVGVPEDGIAGIASDLAGRDLSDFFARFVHGTDDPPLAALLRDAGIVMHLRPADGSADRGGTTGRDRGGRSPAWLGVKLAGTVEPRLAHVFAGGPAQRAGLSAGDTIVAVDGFRASTESLDRVAAERAPGDTISVHAFRRDELVVANVVLEVAPSDTCWLEIDAAADAQARARRAAWLGVDA